MSHFNLFFDSSNGGLTYRYHWTCKSSTAEIFITIFYSDPSSVCGISFKRLWLHKNTMLINQPLQKSVAETAFWVGLIFYCSDHALSLCPVLQSSLNNQRQVTLPCLLLTSLSIKKQIYVSRLQLKFNKWFLNLRMLSIML